MTPVNYEKVLFIKADYQVLGIDISESMIAIARKRVPDAEFKVESLFKVDIPPCKAVISVGECLNYLFDPQSDRCYSEAIAI
nr:MULTISPECIES: class I SAM-dependent methyltransferase [unclassified Coleofasciculus]